MAKQLLGIALGAESESVRLNAIRDALDRAGLKAPTEVVVSPADTKPYEEVFEGITFGGSSESPNRTDLYTSEHPPTENLNTNDVEHHWCNESAPTSPASAPNPCPTAPAAHPYATPHMHVTGEDAIRQANAANRAIGALPPRLAIESRHRRYPRP